MAAAGWAAFIASATRLQAPPRVPELRLHLADEMTRIWELTEAELGAQGVDPPFWAFAWAGGQAVARHLLDTPAEVEGRTVLDLATGSGLVALAALLAGARHATAVDLDPVAAAAARLNAAANGLADRLTVTVGDLTAGAPPTVDVVLAGDVCYDRDMTAAVLPWLRRARAAPGCCSATPAAPTCRRRGCAGWRNTTCRPPPTWRAARSARRRSTS